MTANFMLELKIGLRGETSLHEKANASLEMQLEFQRELKIYQAQAIEINEQLGAYPDRALATNTRLAQLLSQGPLPGHTNVQARHPEVSTEAVQRTIRELVCNLASEIIIRLKGPQTEFHTKLQSRLEGVLDTVEKHFSDHACLKSAKAVHRTVAVHELNLTNAQLTETYECAREITQDLRSLNSTETSS
jgi:hypothetical protein